MLFTILFPILIAACILFCTSVYAACSKASRRGGGKMNTLSMKNVMAKAKKSAVDIAKDGRKSSLKVGGLLALPHLLILSFLVFPMVSSTAFQAFSCEEFDNGKFFLRADFAVQCK